MKHQDLVNRGLLVMLLVLAWIAPAHAETPAVEKNAVTTSSGPEGGYDFEQVVEHWERSLTPLQHEMARKSGDFVAAVKRATALLSAGKELEAIDQVVRAIEQVLVVRERTLKPMWRGQTFFDEQIAEIRARINKFTDAATQEIDAESEKQLNDLAKRISASKDDIDRRRLTIQYKAQRALVEVKASAHRLSPQQRALWEQALATLEDSATVHLQVLVRAEIMFAQLDHLASGLRDQYTLYVSTRGALKLSDRVQAARSVRQSLVQVSQNSNNARYQMDQTVQRMMRDLEISVDAIAQDNHSLVSEQW